MDFSKYHLNYCEKVFNKALNDIVDNTQQYNCISWALTSHQKS